VTSCIVEDSQPSSSHHPRSDAVYLQYCYCILA
jgi:hypothetical protein